MTLRTSTTIALAFAALALGACVSAQGNLSPDYGQSVKQNLAAQIADPDASYRRDTPPAAAGARTNLAQDRYNKGKVIPPTAASASRVGGSGAGAPGAPPT
ncbi:hypothetical protein [Phenylobacterium sp.]|uniref:hypothetical protein n=1 Tax=Phenylobacterium sp. TaxID=1871053 RepID=UPI002737E590|nr:hypothetical protein [Phenylobacterium sp.]MDP3869325.1 hypothetical protein [Phenylobacterium sp.]